MEAQNIEFLTHLFFHIILKYLQNINYLLRTYLFVDARIFISYCSTYFYCYDSYYDIEKNTRWYYLEVYLLIISVKYSFEAEILGINIQYFFY